MLLMHCKGISFGYLYDFDKYTFQKVLTSILGSIIIKLRQVYLAQCKEVIMNKDEILEKSRQENKHKDEMEKEVFLKAGQRSCAVVSIICAIIIVLETFFADHVNLSILALYFAMTGTMLLSKYSKLKKIHELIFGSIQLVLSAICMVLYIMRLVR